MNNNEQQFAFERSKKNESMMDVELMNLRNAGVFSNNSMLDNKEIEIMYDY